MTANFRNRTLYHGDNLEFLRGINSETIDLVATDPPFNKGRDFHATPDSLASGAQFRDRWSWRRDILGDEDEGGDGVNHQDWVDAIQDDWPALWAVIDWSRMTYGDDMGAFLCWLGVRVLEMHRILKPTGSLWLHCDDTAAAYITTMLDAVFGRNQRRGLVTWQRAAGRAKGSQHEARTIGRDTDTLLCYSKSEESTFNGVYRQITEAEKVEKFPLVDERGRYNTDVPLFRQPSMGARPNLCYTYNGVTNPHPSGWRVSRERLAEMDARGEIIWREGKRPLRKSYAADYKGQPVGNCWTDITNLTNHDEKVGYPTQKPVDLYRRIILASSNPGDLVLDPFCGCATTLIAAEQEDRQWIGMDIWEGALNLVTSRLEKECGGEDEHGQAQLWRGTVHVERSAPVRTDDGAVAAPPLKVPKKKARKRSPEPGPVLPRAEMVALLLEQQEGKCAGCNRKYDDPLIWEIDHRIPRSEGGANHHSNRCLLCPPCNRIKSNTLTLTGLHRHNTKIGRMVE